MNDLYTLDLSQQDNLQWDVPCTFGQPPTPRESHSAVLHTAENGKHPRLFVYGGMSGCRLGDVFILDVGKYIFVPDYFYFPYELNHNMYIFMYFYLHAPELSKSCDCN